MAAPPMGRLQPRSVQDAARLAASIGRAGGRDGAAFGRVYRFSSGDAVCALAPELAAKYSMEAENRQGVICVTNRWTADQTWWNPARTLKPQTFKAAAGRVRPEDLDGTRSRPGGCDFCRWPAMTARDAGFGRVELPGAVTASNLFKCAEPCHGVVLFRHHDPLSFDRRQLGDLLDAAWRWLELSEEREGGARGGGGGNGGCGEGGAGGLHPFLLWNCLPRAGASQFHGHAQVLLTREPLPQQIHFQNAAAAYAAAAGNAALPWPAAAGTDEGALAAGGAAPGQPAPGRGGPASASAASLGAGSAAGSGCESDVASPGDDLYVDLLRAHRALGLLRQVTLGNAGGEAGGASSSSSSSLSSSEGGYGGGDGGWEPGSAWAFVSLAPRKDCEVVVVGAHPGCAAFQSLLHAALRALIDRLGVATFNVGLLNLDVRAPHPHAARLEARELRAGDGDGNGGDGGGGDGDPLPRAVALPLEALWVPGERGGGGGGDGAPPTGAAARRRRRRGARPVVARVVARGSLDSAASDFGGLEVLGGASIGHTDPYAVVAALDAQLAALGGPDCC
ncbi:hypothetical protein Rsub_05751 [Raphidocelis subcapitata]|uniref:Uncharacterized protein n=1 Tax=Raphidocelis subcapitata TaxID=307507 RepID=A0A2V0P752_9CHLO|nr:hypothetical protein Rsub_05751 [Raphidocelis subcapitata]|eukprot:GBF92915.1 hypothetical protein Rsub_05751 [Raphidocelis subcapitata]